MVFKYWVVAGRLMAAGRVLGALSAELFGALSEALLGRAGTCSIARCSLLSRLLFIARPSLCFFFAHHFFVLDRLEAIVTHSPRTSF